MRYRYHRPALAAPGGRIALAGATSAGSAYAAYWTTLTVGTASTGTAIGTLYGVVAKRAALACLGGGSLATGGLGMMGGIAILGVGGLVIGVFVFALLSD